MLDEKSGDKMELVEDLDGGIHVGTPKKLKPIIQSNQTALDKAALEKDKLPDFVIVDERRIQIPLPSEKNAPDTVSRYLEVITTDEGETELMLRELKGSSTNPAEPRYKEEKAGRQLLRLRIPPEPVTDERTYEETFGVPRPANAGEIREAFAVAANVLEKVRTTEDLGQIGKHQRLVEKLQSALTTSPNK